MQAGSEESPSGPVGRTGTGLPSNVAAALTYVPALIAGVVFALIEKNDQFVRFHAFQSILFGAAWIALWIALSIVTAVLSLLPFLGIVLSIISVVLYPVLGIGGLLLWIMLVVKAYQGERWKLPYAGDMAEKYASGQTNFPV